MSGLFGPEMMAKIALDPKLRGYMSDPDFMAKLNKLSQDPNSLTSMLSDPRIMEVFQVMLGAQGMQMKTKDDFMNENVPTAPASSCCDDSGCTKNEAKSEIAGKEEKQPEPMEIEE